jgi:hypothetical protein
MSLGMTGLLGLTYVLIGKFAGGNVAVDLISGIGKDLSLSTPFSFFVISSILFSRRPI